MIKYYLLCLFLCFCSALVAQDWRTDFERGNYFNRKGDIGNALRAYEVAGQRIPRMSTDTIGYVALCDSLAGCYAAVGRYDEARDAYYIVINLIKGNDLKTSLTYTFALDNLAGVYEAMGIYDKAAFIYRMLMNGSKRHISVAFEIYAGYAIKLALLEGKFGRTELGCRIIDSARQNIKDYVRIAPEMSFRLAIEEGSLLAEGLNYEVACDTLSAVRSRIVKMIGTDNKMYAWVNHQLGCTYFNRQMFSEAATCLETAKSYRDKTFLNDPQGYFTTCESLSAIRIRQRKLTDAESVLLKALQKFENAGMTNGTNFIDLNVELGECLAEQGLNDRAEKILLKCQTMLAAMGNDSTPLYLLLKGRLALLYFQQGRFGLAENAWQDAQIAYKKMPQNNPIEFLMLCNDMGVFFDHMGRYDRAIQVLSDTKNAIALKEGKESDDYLTVTANLAHGYLNKHMLSTAAELFKEVRETYERNPKNKYPSSAEFYVDLASVATSLYAYDRAEPILIDARDAIEEKFGSQSPKFADVTDILGRLYLLKGDISKAGPLITTAKKIRLEYWGNNHPDYATSCENLAVFNWMSGQAIHADEEFREFHRISSANFDAIFAFSTQSEKAAYEEAQADANDRAYSFYLSNSPRSELPLEISLYYRNKELNSSIIFKNAIMRQKEPLLRQKFNDWLDLKKRWGAAYLGSKTGSNKSLDSLTTLIEALEKELLAALPGLPQKQPDDVWKLIQKKLGPKEAAIEFVKFQLFDKARRTDSVIYAAIILRNNSHPPVMLRLFEQKELDVWLKDFDKLDSEAERIGSIYRHSEALFRLIWAPIISEIGGIHTVYFSPAGDLYKLALGAIKVSDSETLSDRIKLVQMNSTSDILQNTDVRVYAGENMVLYGDIYFDGDSTTFKRSFAQRGDGADALIWNERGAGFTYLEGTKFEADAIEKALSNTGIKIDYLHNWQATEESVKSLDGANSPNILHFATHGFFFPNEELEDDGKRNEESLLRRAQNPLFRSGLALAGANFAWRDRPVEGLEDGLLTAYEVANLYLPKTKLVVLSACETGLGEVEGSEGVYGLQRAFKIAGVKNIIMSLWRVDDSATAEFMSKFYIELSKGQSVDDAFAVAQEQIRRAHPDPYLWAAWVLVH